MANTSATEEQLGKLHQRVAKVLSGALDVYEKAQEEYLQDVHDDLPPPEVNASLLSVMTKFLADNKITCAPAESEALSDLESRLQNKRNRKRVGNVVQFPTDE